MRLRTCCTWIVVLASAATMDRAASAQAAAPAGSAKPAPAVTPAPAATAPAPSAAAPAAAAPMPAPAPAPAPVMTAPPPTPPPAMPPPPPPLAEGAAPPAPPPAPAPTPAADISSVGGGAPGQTLPAPFAYGDFTWLNGYDRRHKALFDTDMISPIFLADVNYTYSFNRPIDDLVVGSTSLFRNNELELLDIGLGAEFHLKNMRGKVLLQFGGRSTVIPRNDVSPLKGANPLSYSLATAYRYLSEAYGGYHWDVMHGLNIDAGIFMSYIGLYSYFSAENWSYQPSFTSDNTPWFFNGVRTQIFPSDKFKFEPWLINGWQSYAKFNEMPSIGFSILWMPTENFKLVSNNYYGWDTPNAPGNIRAHMDNSILLRYYNDPANDFLSKAAFSLTGDAGFQAGDGQTPWGGQTSTQFNGNSTGLTCTTAKPCNANFLSWMLYNRMWFAKDHYGLTLGGGMMHNDSRYLVLPPSGLAAVTNGATANGQTPNNALGTGFDLNSGSTFNGADFSASLQYMPDDYTEFLIEFVHRQSCLAGTCTPYYNGHGGLTGPTGYAGGNTDSPVSTAPNGWKPDLVTSENRIIAAVLVRL